MSARPCTTVSCDEDGNERLPMFHRTIRVPVSLWWALSRLPDLYIALMVVESGKTGTDGS